MEQPTWIGRSLNGRYKIEELLGQGGMSAVYKAIDPNLKRTVAIKLIHSHLLADEDFVYRFKREAAAVAAFRHPNIVQVYDFDNDGEVYYMVLEYIPGETLQDRLKHLKNSDRKMPVDQACRFIINVCDALEYAHRKGMIHRDIKPANIMLDTHGEAILMDFGIVKILDATSHTSTGAVMGTARYMSPEVIRSEAADERSDLYSLGVTFYEMLSGDPPFDADSAMSLLMRHLNDPVPDLTTKRDDLPAELIQIVNKALEKDRNNRYQTAEAMAKDLRRFLSLLTTAPVKPVVPAPQADAGKTEKMQTADQAEPWSAPATSTTISEAPLNQPTEINQNFPGVSPQATFKSEAPVQEAARPVQPAPRPSSMSPLVKYGAIGGVVILLIVTGIFFLSNGAKSASGIDSPTATQTVNITQTEQALLALQQTADAASTQAAIPATASPTETSIPTDTPIPSTPTPSTPYVVITGITLANNKYVVDYEVHNFPSDVPNMHVHMFFNTVPPDQAGVPGSGPWKLTWGPYGDPPFTQYGPANRPVGATQMCSLVANPNHTVIPDSGNCFDLPQ